MIEITCRGLLFDLDGVVVDSTPAVTRCWTVWANQHGFDPADTVRRAHGRPSISTIRELLPRANHEIENAAMEQMEIEDLNGVVALPGALKLLNSLPASQWTIVTSCTRPLAMARLKAAALPVPRRLITATDISQGKPHPEPYLKGAGILNLAPHDCIVVEDAPAGIRSGRAANSKVIAVRTTDEDKFLREAGADWIVDNCAAIRAESAIALGLLSLRLEVHPVR
jgi:sugar-phosphatase